MKLLYVVRQTEIVSMCYYNAKDVRMLCFETTVLTCWAGFMKNAFCANTDDCDPSTGWKILIKF